MYKSPRTTQGHRWFILVSVIVFSLALRYRLVVPLWEYPDEVWSVWQVQGHLSQALDRTPFDWSPLYPVVLWSWVQGVGNTLETARLMNPLLACLTLALVYQASVAWLTLFVRQRTAQQRRWGAIISTLAFGVMAFPVFIGVEARAYGLLMLFGALALWLTLRWLLQPQGLLGVAVAVSYALMFYTSYTSVVFLVFLAGLVALVHLPTGWSRPNLAKMWRQMVAFTGIVLVTVVLCAPQLWHLWQARGRLSARDTEALSTYPNEMAQLVNEMGGNPVWIGVLGLGVVLMVGAVLRRQVSWRGALLLAIWGLAFPTLLYATHNEFLLRPRYVWWVALGICCYFGILSTVAGIWGYRLVALILVGLALAGQNYAPFQLTVQEVIPFRYVLSEWAKVARPNDVLVIDPRCTCGRAYEWDYFVPQMVASGYLPIVTTVSNEARVWYLSSDAGRDEALRQTIEQGRTPSTYFGPWYFLLRLYERPSYLEGVAFDGKIALNDAEIVGNPFAVAEGETVTIRLQWSALEPLNADYSVSVALFRDNELIAQSDSAPTSANTSSWKLGAYYEDIRTLTIPVSDNIDGDLEVRVAVYQWWDGVRLIPAQNAIWQTTDNDYLVIKTLRVWAW